MPTNVSIAGYVRGEKYYSYVVVVTDARGKVVMLKTPANWLRENLGNLRKLSVGNYMDKTRTRTFPTRPKTLVY